MKKIKGFLLVYCPYDHLCSNLAWLNTKKCYCTNSIHQIYFKDVNINTIRWIQMSFLSPLTLLDLELNAKTYGVNVLKIEPTKLKNTRVFSCNEHVNIDTYNKISSFLSQGEKIKAVVCASNYIYQMMGVSKTEQIRINNCLNTIRQQRMGEKGYINFELQD